VPDTTYAALRGVHLRWGSGWLSTAILQAVVAAWGTGLLTIQVMALFGKSKHWLTGPRLHVALITAPAMAVVSFLYLWRKHVAAQRLTERLFTLK
jgi:hypothetical protein